MPKQLCYHKLQSKNIWNLFVQVCYLAVLRLKYTQKHLKHCACYRYRSVFHNCDQICLVHSKWQGTVFTTNQLLHQWTNDPCVYHCQWFTGLLFLGLFSQAFLMCSSAQVVFKWQWCDWKGTHPVVNCHMIGQIVWLSNWLLFVISRALMGFRWDLLAVSTLTCGKTSHFCGSPQPPTSTPIWSFVIVV